MNTNNPITPANLDEYESMAVKNSNNAKRVAAAAATFVGGAVVAGGTTYAMTSHKVTDAPLTEMDVVAGADVASVYQDEVEQTQAKVVKVQHQPQPEPEPKVEWNEEDNVYVDGQKVSTVMTGEYDGHEVAVVDEDGNGLANRLMVDVNGNGTFESSEVTVFEDSDGVVMGHHAPKVNNHYLNSTALNEDPNIKNDFSDEKTGEEYHDDLAENNPDYNPNGLDGCPSPDAQDIFNDDDIMFT